MIKLSIILIFLLTSSYSYAYRKAFIRPKFAIIYADSALNIPIGKARRRKTVYVSDVSRNNGTVFPIYVSGKIAFIKSVDVMFSNKSKSSIRFQTTFNKQNQHYTYKSSVALFMAQFTPDAKWLEYSDSLEDYVSNMYSAKISYERHKINNMWGFGIGFAHYILDQNILSMQISSIEVLGFITPLNFNFFSLNLFAGFMMSPLIYTVFDLSNRDVLRGMGYGPILGGQIKLFPKSKFTPVLGVEYKLINTLGFDEVEIQTSEGHASTKIANITGTNIYLGISYNY